MVGEQHALVVAVIYPKFCFNSEAPSCQWINRSVKKTTPFHHQSTHNDATISNPFGYDVQMFIALRDFFLSGEPSIVYTILTIIRILFYEPQYLEQLDSQGGLADAAGGGAA